MKEQILAQKEKARMIDKYMTKEKQKGRIEHREYELYKIDYQQLPRGWNQIHRLIYVKRWGVRQNKAYKEEAYYISNNKKLDAKSFGRGIRNHWRIENNLHWVKDVQQKEDKNRIVDRYLATIISILQTTVINIFRLNSEPSILMSNEKYANRVKMSYKLISDNLLYEKNRSD